MSDGHGPNATRKPPVRDSYRPAEPNEAALAGHVARIRGAVEVVGGVDGTLHALAGPVEDLPARVEPDDVLVGLVFVVEVLGKAKAVAERAVDDAAGPSVGRFQVIAVQVMSRGSGHARAPTLMTVPCGSNGACIPRESAAIVGEDEGAGWPGERLQDRMVRDSG